MHTLSQIREKTLVLDEEVLIGIRERINESELSWEEFFKPKSYEDFMVYEGKEFNIDNELYTFKDIRYFEADTSKKKKKGALLIKEAPLSACSTQTSRFGHSYGGCDIPFPVDGDIQIYCIFSKVNKKLDVSDEMSRCWNEKILPLSYYQLAGLLSSGRAVHWTEPRAFHSKAPHNTFIATLLSNWLSDPLYRVTPEGQPKVNEIIHPGTCIQSNYCNTVYIVERVHGPHYYEPIERDENVKFEYFSLSLIDEGTRKGGFGMGDLVAVNGEIKQLFMNNNDFIKILGHGHSIHSVSDNEDEGEEDEFFEDEKMVEIPIIQSPKKLVQLSLF